MFVDQLCSIYLVGLVVTFVCSFGLGLFAAGMKKVPLNETFDITMDLIVVTVTMYHFLVFGFLLSPFYGIGFGLSLLNPNFWIPLPKVNAPF